MYKILRAEHETRGTGKIDGGFLVYPCTFRLVVELVPLKAAKLHCSLVSITQARWLVLLPRFSWAKNTGVPVPPRDGNVCITARFLRNFLAGRSGPWPGKERGDLSRLDIKIQLFPFFEYLSRREKSIFFILPVGGVSIDITPKWGTSLLRIDSRIRSNFVRNI